MGVQKITQYSQYQEIVVQYRRSGCMVNDYILGEAGILSADGRLYAMCGVNNAVLLVKKPVGMRVYYYINDFDEEIELSDGDYVLEILYREALGVPNQEIDYWEKQGFGKNRVRDQYVCMNRDVTDIVLAGEIEIESAATLDEVAAACHLFNASFDHLSGNYIDEEEFPKLLAETQILVARGHVGEFLGALHHQKCGKVSWLHHLAVDEKSRGKGVGEGLCRRWMDQEGMSGALRYMLWVQRQNLSAVSLYKKLGFKYNGKSSLSLIKRRNNGKTA